MTDPFEPHVKEFILSMKILNFAPDTIKIKHWKLNRFIAYLKQNNIFNIDQITVKIIQAYRVELYQALNIKGIQNSAAHQNSMISVVRQFTRFLYEKNYIVSDPGKKIAYAKTPRMLPRSILSTAEARRIIHAPDTRTITGYRDRTLLEVIYTSGIRKKEINNLTLDDADYHEGFLRIDNGKGRKDRMVPMGKIACRYLENYIKSVRPELVKAPHNNHLFLTIQGKPLSKNLVWDLVKKYAKKAGIKKNVHPHTFRHSCATGMLKNHADLNCIRKILGHKSLSTTQIYTHLTITDLKRVHKQCHPREKDKE